ncbi:hypothetical protein [Priestia megaterium]|uniref:hypothetical protein n=1 Tax=Priestia megaterium TaxID=1404 RepID=UPI0013E3B401|nr:hypothetical protein [Priestia megaterium]MED3863188.1 hypothetical protein [Priestia megaterium]MED4101860.1 hypothetical protein [Priestia megaterium]MED4142115.1 hypothetical protein [Priestia megaterium]MED4166603.1 hypothetical protein [Priestia megaterium]MED4201990.1 hypothetical protein [Priestia megaterium]
MNSGYFNKVDTVKPNEHSIQLTVKSSCVLLIEGQGSSAACGKRRLARKSTPVQQAICLCIPFVRL